MVLIFTELKYKYENTCQELKNKIGKLENKIKSTNIYPKESNNH